MIFHKRGLVAKLGANKELTLTRFKGFKSWSNLTLCVMHCASAMATAPLVLKKDFLTSLKITFGQIILDLKLR